MPADPASVTRARALIGTRFRLHGRDPRYGLDCVGLVAAAHAIDDAPSGYPLRFADTDAIAALLDAIGQRVAGGPQAGDIMLIAPGPAQRHLGVWSGTGLVHAHAGLRRIVETPGPVSGRLIGIWRRG